mgnify:CR=1 FL=1
MAKDVINVDGKDVVVREDRAKAFRFVHWGIATAAIALALMAVLFATFFWKASQDGTVETPAQAANSNTK